nr:hypothetical protein [Tanacetum cinerariifolium]
MSSMIVAGNLVSTDLRFCTSSSSQNLPGFHSERLARVRGDENPIHTLGDYSKPSLEGYRNTIELPVGNNMVNMDVPNITMEEYIRLEEEKLVGMDSYALGNCICTKGISFAWKIVSLGIENVVNILKSIDEGPFQMGTVREPLAKGTEGATHLGPERHRVYSYLSPKEKDWYNSDIRETNILLQGLVTAVKLNRGLRDSDYDKLYAYLKQHETHPNKNKMMLDRFSHHAVDPIALMSNVSHQQHYSQSSSTPPSIYVPPHLADNAHLDSGLSSTDNLIKNLTNTLALLTQSYKTFLPQTNNQLRTSSNTKNQATVQDSKVMVQNVQGQENRGQGTNLRSWGIENVVNILKSIDEGPFQMGTVREPLTKGTEGASHLGPERHRVYSYLSPKEKDWYNSNIRETNILLQGLPKDIYTRINHYTDAKDIWDNVKMLLEGSELTKEDQES